MRTARTSPPADGRLESGGLAARRAAQASAVERCGASRVTRVTAMQQLSPRRRRTAVRMLSVCSKSGTGSRVTQRVGTGSTPGRWSACGLTRSRGMWGIVLRRWRRGWRSPRPRRNAHPARPVHGAYRQTGASAPAAAARARRSVRSPVHALCLASAARWRSTLYVRLSSRLRRIFALSTLTSATPWRRFATPKLIRLHGCPALEPALERACATGTSVLGVLVAPSAGRACARVTCGAPPETRASATTARSPPRRPCATHRMLARSSWGIGRHA
mmetsp:Transcript_29424/g.75339  ORF Transcript_29424/g.75339 Transcript_29424/m.75339 type:complete len:274 (-) Transcript_29424:2618-3439(-)